jgi:hypothetical protein
MIAIHILAQFTSHNGELHIITVVSKIDTPDCVGYFERKSSHLLSVNAQAISLLSVIAADRHLLSIYSGRNGYPADSKLGICFRRKPFPGFTPCGHFTTPVKSLNNNQDRLFCPPEA